MLVKEANTSMPRIVGAVESVEDAKTMSSADDLFSIGGYGRYPLPYVFLKNTEVKGMI